MIPDATQGLFSLKTIKTKSKSLKSTFITWFLVLSLIPLVILGGLSYTSSTRELTKAAVNELSTTSYLTTYFIQDWLDNKFFDLNLIAEASFTQELLSAYKNGLQKKGLTANEFVRGEAWTDITINTAWPTVKASYEHPNISNIYLLDLKGNILYSVEAEEDLGLNIFESPLENTLFKQAVEHTLETGRISFSGLERYELAENNLASFMTRLVYLDEDIPLGVIAFRINLDSIFELLKSAKQQDTAIHHYLITKEGDLLTPVEDDWSEVLKKKVSFSNLSVKEIHNRRHTRESASEVTQYKGPSGDDVLGIHRPVQIKNQQWVLVTEIKKKVAYQNAYFLGVIILICVATIGVLVVISAFSLTRRILEPIEDLLAVTQDKHGYRRAKVSGEHEISKLAQSFNDMLDTRDRFEKDLIKSSEQVRSAMKLLEQRQYALDQYAIIAITDTKGTITHCNQMFEQISGYSKDELLGQNHRILKSDRHPRSFFKHMFDTIASGKVWHGEICNKNKSGQEYWVATTIVPFKDDSGKPISYVAMRSDITQLKAIETKLEESKSQLELVIDSTSVGFWDMDMITGNIECNDRWFEISGFSKSDFEPFSIDDWRNFIHPQDLTRAMVQLESYFTGSTDHYQTELRFKSAKGGWIWCMDSGKLVEEQDGIPHRIIGTTLDISSLKSAEAELKKSLSLTQAVLDSTDNGILVTSAESEILVANARVKKLWKFDFEKFTTRNRLKTVSKMTKNPERFLKRIEYIDKDDKEVFNDTIELNNGKILERVSLPMTFEEAGEHTKGRVWSFRDITEVETINNELRDAKNQAEAAVKAKSDFLASMSHEIRTPMNGVLGMLSLLLQSDLSDNQKRRVEIAQSSANSLLSLINDILDFSKVDAGKLDLEWIEFDLIQMLNDFVKSMAYSAQQKGLELVLDTSEVEESEINGDPSRIRQILSNLTSNAIKFTQTGAVSISVQLNTDANSDNRILCCQIKDTGIGIPKDKLDKVFQSFSQVDASTTRKFGGTGLGLAIVKRLCELMEGDINVSSAVGVGSVFSFNLKLKAVPNQSRFKPDPTNLKSSILIVEPNPILEKAIATQLNKWQLRHCSINSPQRAIEYIEQNIHQDESCLILINHHFPGSTPDVFINKVRLQFPDHNIRFNLMVPMADSEHLPSFLSASDRQIPKPVTSLDLLDSLFQDKNTDHQIKTNQTNDDHPPEPAGDASSIVTWPNGCRILLVEDNQINQIVALGILENMHLAIEVAWNGLEALKKLAEATNEDPFNLVLMDCQMPEMDGFETTHAIRDSKAGDRYQSIPVVAMTANAMQGDREKCLAAGMNDYLAKPISAEQLFLKLQQWLPKKAANDSVENKMKEDRVQQSPQQNSLIWDRDSALKRVMGKESLLNSLVTMFLNDMPGRLQRLKQAVDENDVDTIVHEAHTIKGVAANLSTEQLKASAETLEQNAKQGSGMIIEMMKDVISSYEQTIKILSPDSNIDPKASETLEKTAPTLSIEDLEILLKDLKEHLEAGDFIDVDDIEHLPNANVPSGIKTQLEALIQQVTQFQNDQALETIDNILTHQDVS